MAVLFDLFDYRMKQNEQGILLDRWGGLGGKQYPSFPLEARMFFLKKILHILLLHDKIYIRLNSLEEFIDILGIEATSALIRRDELQIYKDWTSPCFLLNEHENSFMFMNLSEQDSNGHVLKRLKAQYQRSQYSYFENILENSLIEDMETSMWDNDAKYNMYRDFELSSFRGYMNITSEDSVSIKEEDIIAQSRLFIFERSLEWAKNLEANEVQLEGDTKLWLWFRNGNEPNETLAKTVEKIMVLRQMPSLEQLYYNKLLTIDEVLKIRDDVNGIKFRQWASSNDYNPEELEKILFANKSSSVKDKFMSWGTATLLGTILPGAGVAYDLFCELKNNLLRDWTPDIFFDKTLTDAFKKINRKKGSEK